MVLTLLAVLLVLLVFAAGLRWVAVAGDRRQAAEVELRRLATPPYLSGPDPRFDRFGRPL